MLQEIMEHINNYFVPICAKEVEYTISNGMISPLFDAAEGDRFYICGSRRNDGVYTWKESGIRNDDDTDEAGLQDETFAGTIRVCSVPPALLTLSGEIKTWVEANGAVLNGVMQSESFNGYSYTLKSGSREEGKSGLLSWQDFFGKRLERWRKPFI